MPEITLHKIPSELNLAVEDAVLFGSASELDRILDIVEGDDEFPENLRHGLEALRYFRSYYGRDGELAPDNSLKKQKIALMESAWGAEMLELLRHSDVSAATRMA